MRDDGHDCFVCNLLYFNVLCRSLRLMTAPRKRSRKGKEKKGNPVPDRSPMGIHHDSVNTDIDPPPLADASSISSIRSTAMTAWILKGLCLGINNSIDRSGLGLPWLCIMCYRSISLSENRNGNGVCLKPCIFDVLYPRLGLMTAPKPSYMTYHRLTKANTG